MKTLIAISGAVILVAAGCSTSRDYYGASDEFFETPSWGTAGNVSSGSASSTDAANDSLEQDGARHHDTRDTDMPSHSHDSSDPNMDDMDLNDPSSESQQ